MKSFCDMNSEKEIDKRLLCCAKLVRTGSVAAVIGSDHAYLPIYLVKMRICPSAIASDINEGPVNRAKLNVAVSGLSKKITVMKADGLDEAAKLSPDDIIIAGMGGELIRDIIDASEYVKNPNVRLILQPMTMPEILREYLAENGFDIVEETVCVAADKCYQIISAHFDGQKRKFDRVTLLLGEKNIERMSLSPTADDTEMLCRTVDAVERRINGRKMSQTPDVCAIKWDEELVAFCKKLLWGNGDKNANCK